MWCCWLFFFRTLIEHGEHVHFFAVKENAWTFHAQIGNEDCCQCGIEDWDEVARLIGDQSHKVEATRDFEFAFQWKVSPAARKEWAAPAASLPLGQPVGRLEV